MKISAAASAVLCVVLGATLAFAVNTGDELYSKDTSGTFYVFADKVFSPRISHL